MTAPASLRDNKGLRGVASLSKKGYAAIEKALVEKLNDEATVQTVMATIREVLHFDPGVSRYTPKVLEQTRAWRARHGKKLHAETLGSLDDETTASKEQMELP